MDTIERADRYAVTSLEDLARLYDKPAERVIRKEMTRLDQTARAFIAASPFVLLATGGKGGLDCSPKGDAPGFVQVLDDTTVLIPDRRGNNRIDGLKNLVEDPHVGLIFLVPGSNETFRINGRARVTTDPALLARFEVNGKQPRTVIVVTIEQAFPHCPKALVRGDIWRAGARGRPAGVPTIGSFAAARDGGDSAYAAAYDADYAKRMPGQLY